MRDVHHIFILSLMLLLILGTPVRAADDDDTSATPPDLIIVDRGKIAEVLRSDMIMLDNNRRYRLDNIRVPPYEDPPAKEELERAFLNANVIVYADHNVDDEDKHNVPIAHIVTDKGVWIEQALISKGLVWVDCTEGSEQIIGILKQAEERARAQHKGFWANPAYAIKTSESVKDYINSYQIVEGKILSIFTKGSTGMVFLNFGKDMRRDFTVRFKQIDLPFFMEDPATGKRMYADNFSRWKGKLVRVRGWVTKEDAGPAIVLTRKEEIDILPQIGQ